MGGRLLLARTPESTEFLARDSWETNVPFGLDLEHDFIGKHRVTSHQESDAKWWGVKYTEKGPLPQPGKEVADIDGNIIGKLSSGAPSPSLGNVGIGIGYISGVSEGDEIMVVASLRKSVKAVVVRASICLILATTLNHPTNMNIMGVTRTGLN